MPSTAFSSTASEDFTKFAGYRCVYSGGLGFRDCWALVKGFSLSCCNKVTILFAKDPHYGNLNQTP